MRKKRKTIPRAYRLCQVLILMHMLHKKGIEDLVNNPAKIGELEEKMTPFYLNKYIGDLAERNTKSLKNSAKKVPKYIPWISSNQDVIKKIKNCATKIRTTKKRQPNQRIDLLNMPEFRELLELVEKRIKESMRHQGLI